MTDPIGKQLTEAQIIEKIIQGEAPYFELLMRRTNPFLYKIGRSYGFNHHDVEDLMQEAHISAYLNIAKFQQRSTYKTWLIRIMINHCNQRLQKFSFKNEKPNEHHVNEKSIPMYSSNHHTDTSKRVTNKELGHVLEKAIEHIPLEYRQVFCLRELNGLSVSETAQVMELTEVNVKVRLNRAKNMLRKQVEKMYSSTEDIYEFNLIYCDAIVEKVMQRIEALHNQ